MNTDDALMMMASNRIDELRAERDGLKAENATLRARVTELEGGLDRLWESLQKLKELRS